MQRQTMYEAPFEPRDRQTFASADDRKRLTPAAIEGFKRIVEKWGVGNAEAAALLGVSTPTWTRMKGARGSAELNQDQLTRVSAILGIFKALNIIFVGGMADRWAMLNNKGPLFRGRAPVEAMIAGGIPAMVETRQYLDALRGGL